MSRTDRLKEIKLQLEDLIDELNDELRQTDLARSEEDHYLNIEGALAEQLVEMDYLIASMDAADERETWDEDGNLENDYDNPNLDGSIW